MLSFLARRSNGDLLTSPLHIQGETGGLINGLPGGDRRDREKNVSIAFTWRFHLVSR